MGKKIFIKSFCKTCGVPIDNKGGSITQEILDAIPEPGRTWVAMGKTHTCLNTRVLDGLDLEQLKKSKGFSRMETWNLPPLYENP